MSRSSSSVGWPSNSPRARSRTGCRRPLVGGEDRQGEHHRPHQCAYGIPDRVYVTNISKAKELADQLQHLHRLHPHLATPAGRLWPAPGGVDQDRSSGPIAIDWYWGFWTKGGREREIPVRTLEQRQLIDEAKALTKGRSCRARLYHLSRLSQHFRYECERVGIHAPWASPFLRASALSRIDWLGVPRAAAPSQSSSRRSRRPSIVRHGKQSAMMGHGRSRLRCTRSLARCWSKKGDAR
jgi:hypothetical protein